MDRFKGTKGIWSTEGNTFIKSENGKTIAAYFAQLHDYKNIKADSNGRLIAAVPELLEFANHVSEIGYTYGERDSEESIAIFELHKKAELIINKALGINEEKEIS